MPSSLTWRLTGVVVLLAAFGFTGSASAQTISGGVTGKCTGADGNPLVGYTIRIERQETSWSSQVKTNKKGEYLYIGLQPGTYKLTLLNVPGVGTFSNTRRVGMGDPTVIDFDIAKEKAAAYKQQMANPETAKKIEEQQKEQKQYTGLKATFDQATLLYNQKRYSEAAAMYEQALPMAKDKNLTIVLGLLGDSYEKAATKEPDRDSRIRDQQKAIDYCQKAIQFAPNDATLHGTLGAVYADMGKVAEAQAELQKAADLNPAGASSYYYNLGVVMVNQGKMDEAAVSLKKATDLDPTNANAFYWYGMALLGKAEYKPDGTVVAVPGTVEAFQKYLKLKPNGEYAQAAQASIDQLKSTVPTEYKAQKKKKS
jgi:tetratricopeptide (TPR) repeat protein